MTTSRPSWGRTFPLDNIEIISRAKGGDGRTVEAYAAVFGEPTEVQDQHGHYFEKINRAAFNRTLSSGSAKRAMVLYNHGYSVVSGREMPEYGVPLGNPLEIKADGRGLLTRTRYNDTLLADSVLASIKNGDIKGQSFRGSVYRSTPDRVPKIKRGGELPTVERMELGLSDYGPTPNPYYEGASIVAVRSHLQVLSTIEDLPEAELKLLIRSLTAILRSQGPDTEDPTVNPATSVEEPGAEDPQAEEASRSGRLALLRTRAAMVFDGK